MHAQLCRAVYANLAYRLSLRASASVSVSASLVLKRESCLSLCLCLSGCQAVKQSRVKVKGIDVVASYKIMVLLVLVPLFNLIYGAVFGLLFLQSDPMSRA